MACHRGALNHGEWNTSVLNVRIQHAINLCETESCFVVFTCNSIVQYSTDAGASAVPRLPELPYPCMPQPHMGRGLETAEPVATPEPLMTDSPELPNPTSGINFVPIDVRFGVKTSDQSTMKVPNHSRWYLMSYAGPILCSAHASRPSGCPQSQESTLGTTASVG